MNRGASSLLIAVALSVFALSPAFAQDPAEGGSEPDSVETPADTQAPSADAEPDSKAEEAKKTEEAPNAAPEDETAKIAADAVLKAPTDQSEPKAKNKVYSLKSVTTLALRNAAVIREFEAKLQKAKWQEYRANWAWAPSIKTTTFFAPVPEKAEVGSFASNLDQYLALNVGPFVRFKAELGIPIYTFGKISTAQELAEIGVDVAKMKQEEARLDVLYQVRRAYHSIQLANEFQALLDEGSSILKPKLETMEEDREFGEADFSTEDFRKVQIFDAEFDSRILDNKKLNDIASAGLRYFTGIEGDFGVKKVNPDEAPAELAALERYKDVAAVMRPDWRMLREAVRARGLQVEMAKSNIYPDIAFGTTVTLGWSTEEISLESVCRRPTPTSECVDTNDLFARPYGNPFSQFSVNFGLIMKWDVNYWQLRGKLGEAEADLATTQAQYDRARGGIELEIEKLYVDASSALERLRVQERRLEAARRWRDQFGLSVQTAGTDISKGIDPLKAFFESKALQLQARYEYQVARAALAKGIGVAELSDVSVY